MRIICVDPNSGGAPMLTLGQVVRATLLRFFPAAGTGLLALTALLVPGSPSDMPLSGWLYMTGILGVQTLGFMLTLLGYRHRLDASAEVTGKRSVVVGALSSALLLTVATGGQGFLPQWGLWVAATLTGTGAAAMMYWPWLNRIGQSERLAHAPAVLSEGPSAGARTFTQADKLRR
jgi:hypothetical protein